MVPFENFQALLVWIVGSAVAGALASWLQQRLKEWGVPWPEDVSQKIVALVLCAVAGIGVYVVQFQFGFILFPELSGPSAIVLTIWLVLSGSQAAYALTR